MQRRFWTLVAEGFAIVASILLAFAIDAWWEARGEHAAAQAAMRRLISEYEQNLEKLADVRQRHEDVLGAIAGIMPLFAPDQSALNASDDVGLRLVGTLSNPVFTPRLGATRSLQASGELALIEDADLQAMLSEWESAVRDVIDWQEIERMHGEERIVPLTYDFIAWPDVDAALGNEEQPSAFASDYDALFRSRRLEGLYFNRRWNNRESVRRIDELTGQTEVLIERLRSQLDD